MRNIVYVSILLLCFAGCSDNKSKTAKGTEEQTTMQEKYRPQVHFSPASGWMNDPNGMVYYAGEYHLFYQHYPHNTQWGPMHWGHAISSDLMHWEEQPIALYPDNQGYIFSGSAVVDWKNTSGLGVDGEPPLVAFFTYHNPEIAKEGGVDVESQALAFSNDKGRTWVKYTGNPVIKNPGIRDFRDPKVFWHPESNQWIMSIAAGQVIQFYASPNCLEWTYLSEFGKGVGNHDGVWECPDLFPLQVKDNGETRWVLVVNINPGGPAGGSATQYFTGHFDGKQFTSEQRDALWADYGKDNYAGVTWSDAPDNRRIFLGWMNNWQYAGKEPTSSWSGAGTIPRELALVKEGSTYLLTSTPVKELKTLHGASAKFESLQVENVLTLSDDIPFDISPIELKLVIANSSSGEAAQSGEYGVRIKNKKGEYITVGYDRAKKTCYVDRTNATGSKFSNEFAAISTVPYQTDEPEIDWHLIIDNSSLEFFAGGYKVAMTNVFYPSDPFDVIEIFTEGGILDIKEILVTELHSVWR